MPLRATVVVAAVAAAIGIAGPGTAGAAGGWQLEDVAIPGGYPGAYFSIATTDGKGNFAGSVYIAEAGTETDLTVWTGDRVSVVRNPLECTTVRPVDQNSSGLIAVTANDCWYSGGQAYTYDGNGFRSLATPGGYGAAAAVAISPNGDVLGRVWDSANGEPDAAVLWRPGVEAPELIPYTLPGQYPVDLDDDGTVLFQTETGAAIRRGGTTTSLAKPASFEYLHVYAIRRGIVVGSASHEEYNGVTAFWWPTPGTPMVLTGATEARDINASGLVVGGLMTWKNGRPAGALPDPYEGSGGAYKVGDDGTVLGSFEPDYRTTVPAKWVNASRR